MATIAQLLSAKLQAEGLSVSAAAQKAGVSLVSFRGVLNGASLPNARSRGKYADFLGITPEELTRGRARKAGSKAGSKVESHADTIALLVAITAKLRAADALAADPLVAGLSKLSKKQRAVVFGLIRSLTDPVLKAPSWEVGATNTKKPRRSRLRPVPSMAKERAAMIADGAVDTGSAVVARREEERA